MGGGEEVSTFLSSSSSSACIADRAYNVQSIAQAALGPYSIVDIPLATPNKLTAIMAPIRTNNNDSNNENSNTNSGLLQVDLFTVSRRQETIDATHFDCSEVVREIVSLARKTAARLVFKEIETTSLYSYNPTTQEISCRQRSASFLLPSQTDAVRMRQWERARGRPVDVRFYTVTYVPRRS